MKPLLKNSFWQLMIVYTAIVVLIALGFFSKYAIQFNILAVIIGIIGTFSLNVDGNSGKMNKKLHYSLLAVALLFIIVIRIIPYLHNNIPLGYDPGLYKYGIEHGLANKDLWILQGGMEPGFLYLMSFFKIFLSIDLILKSLLIFFCIILGLGVYFVSKEHFGEITGILSVFLYALSIIQFQTFWFMYYKNIIGLSTILFSLYFLKRYEKEDKKLWKYLFILLAGLTGAIHRPTFYIFGLSYFFYVFISPYENKRYNKTILKENILSGILILAIAGIFYIGDFFQAVIVVLPWIANGFISPGESGGTFINFFTYQYSILPYFVLAIVGLIVCLRKRVGILEIWAVINLAIVYFQFFFFNRFIIMLDISLILFAGYGFSLIIENKKKLGVILAILLILSLGVFALTESRASKPLIGSSELNAIEQLRNTPNESFVMSTSAIYSPWVLGWSERRTIAPGLFNYDNHTKEQWGEFWASSDIAVIKQFLSVYGKPLYIFIGKQQNDNLAQFANAKCFESYFQEENNTIYRYVC